MRLYSKNAEQLLLDKAKSISEQHTSWRCIHIDFASRKDLCSEGLRTHVVTNIIKELLENEEGYIYLCDDGDVFILFQGKAKDIVDRLGEHFKGLGEIGKSSGAEDALYHILDLSLQWNAFVALCEEKALLPLKKAEKIQQNGIAQAHKPLRDLDEMLFNAIAARRSERNRLTVLVVEDDPFTRRLVVGALKGAFEVVEAADGAAAIAAYESSAPDAVFLDIELPDTNGHIILNKLLSFDKTAFIVMLSANSIKENILAALEKGAQGFVTKPFAKEKLIHYLRNCEAMRRANSVLQKGDAHV